MAREALLARTFVELADSLVDDFDVVDVLTVLADRCVDVLDVAAAGIMLADPAGGLMVVAASDQAMRLLELFELQAQEGPCFDCFRTGQPVEEPDLGGAGRRWPHFAPEAIRAGFRSANALPMRLRGTVIGALNLFQVDTGAMRGSDAQTAQAMADVATIAVLQHRAALEAQLVNEQLQQALDSRIVIEQAKGIISERLNVDMEGAFASLRSFTRRQNLRLADVARGVVEGTISHTSLDAPPDAST